MPTSLVSTGVQFPDSTIQTTAAVGGGANIQSFPATGTYTKPPGAKFVMVELWGAGGGGGRTYSTYSNGGEGGGGGAYATKMFAAPEVGATETVTVGAGGSGYTGTGQGTGGTGGTTNFGTLLYAGGGSGGSRLAGPCSYTPTGVGGNSYGPSVPTCYRLITSVLVWGGGPGGQVVNNTGYPLIGSGKVSLFGGGGGAGGASLRPCNPGNSGGVGRLFGSNTSNLRTPTASTDYSGGGSLSPVDGGNFVGGSSQGGQGNPWPGVRLVNGNGGIAAGGAGQTMFFPNPGSSPNANTSGNGGNGYAVVYTW